MKLSNEYAAKLRLAMRPDVVKQFIRVRLTQSLDAINIRAGCIDAIQTLLQAIAYGKVDTGEVLESEVGKFQKTWRVHLNRAYFGDYERIRWPYLRENILRDTKVFPRLGRCLDVGCGRGCLTTEIIRTGAADEIVGIDTANYEAEWNERIAEISPATGLKFARVGVEDFPEWAQRQSKFDTILLLYVLHHSTEFWVIRTLRGLRDLLHAQSRVIVLEDSCSISIPPRLDRDNINELWLKRLASINRS